RRAQRAASDGRVSRIRVRENLLGAVSVESRSSNAAEACKRQRARPHLAEVGNGNLLEFGIDGAVIGAVLPSKHTAGAIGAARVHDAPGKLRVGVKCADFPDHVVSGTGATDKTKEVAV